MDRIPKRRGCLLSLMSLPISWLGNSALSNLETVKPPPSPSEPRFYKEFWCNAVAAEFLVPLSALEERLSQSKNNNPLDSLNELARVFKVSELVILRRLLDRGRITREKFNAVYKEKTSAQKKSTSSSGNFYYTLLKRVSRRFAQAACDRYA